MKKILLTVILVLLFTSVCYAEDYYVGYDKEGTWWFETETIKFQETQVNMWIDFWAKQVLYYDQGIKRYYVKVLLSKTASPMYAMVIQETYDNTGKLIDRQEVPVKYEDLIKGTMGYAVVNEVVGWIVKHN